MLWASSDSINTMLGFAYVGPLWFLFALFWCRELHYILSLSFSRLASTNVNFYILAVCATISYVASYVHSNYYFPLPFCITQGLSCMVFYAVGSFYKKINSLPIWCMCFLALSWALALWIGGMNLESCSYKIYIIDVLGACGATYIIGWFLKVLYIKMKDVFLINVCLCIIIWCGLYSLVILCMHTLEMYSGFLYSVVCRLSFLRFLLGYGQIFIAIVMSYILIKIPVLKVIYT